MIYTRCCDTQEKDKLFLLGVGVRRERPKVMSEFPEEVTFN